MKQLSNKISVFKNARETSPTLMSLNNYFKGIKEGEWQDEVIEYRNNKRKKTDITAVTVSGTFEGRKDSELIEHSGLLVIDIDDKDQTLKGDKIRNSLKEIPEILAIHYSLGGKGLAVYFKINKAKHAESFEEITKMLINDYGIIPDMHCGNVGRLRFVSYDPELHVNTNATAWNYFQKKEKRTTVNEAKFDNIIYSGNDIDYVLQQIKQRALNIAPDYYSWLRIAFALASKLGPSGRDAFRLISSYYFGKQKIDPDKQYDRCLKADKGHGTSISSFFYYAKLAGCEIVSERTKKITTIGRIRRKQESQGGGSIVNGKSDARQYLTEFEGISGADVDDVLQQIWDKPIKDIAIEEGTLNDIEVYLKSNYTFRMNEITNIVEVNGEPMNDYAFNTIYLKCSKVIEKATKDKVFDLIHSDFTPKYNPLLEWFEKNKHIKSEGNVKKLAECIESSLKKRDPDFVRYFLEKWLLSIVASAHGTYSILCMVLTGAVQGTGKTNFFRELLPEPLRWLFSINKLDAKEADVGTLMCSKLLILDDEFGGKSKQDEKRFKELISKDVFSIRKPYGRYFEDMQRLAVLCGTTNEEQVINDLTGNRRIIPIQVNYVDETKFQEIDKTALFSELYWKFRKDPKGWFLNKEDIERLNEVCFDSNQVAPEMELPLKYFEYTENNSLTGSFLTASEIRSIIERHSGIRLSQQKLSIALKNIGYVYDIIRNERGQLRRGFWVYEKMKTYDDENAKFNENEQKNDENLPF